LKVNKIVILVNILIGYENDRKIRLVASGCQCKNLVTLISFAENAVETNATIELLTAQLNGSVENEETIY
jgi:hypothetical protein